MRRWFLLRPRPPFAARRSVCQHRSPELGINENPLEHTLAAVKVIKQHSKDWKITYAGDWHPELSSRGEDYSAVINREPGRDDVRGRSARGFTTGY